MHSSLTVTLKSCMKLGTLIAIAIAIVFSVPVSAQVLKVVVNDTIQPIRSRQKRSW